MVNWFDIGIILLAVLVGAGVYPAIAATAGQPEAQKTVYLAHDIANLVEVVSSLPEDANYLVQDNLDGTAELTDGKLIVQGEYLRTPTVNVPSNIELFKKTTPIDFLYVRKEGNEVFLTSVKKASCLKVVYGGMMNSRITIQPLIVDDADEDLLNHFTKTINNVLKDRYNIMDGRENDLRIEIRKGPAERIIIGEGVNRKHSSLSCFISEKTGLNIEYQDEVTDRVIIEITENSYSNILGFQIIEGLEAYYNE